MQLLNCLLALGGDLGNTVPKTRITAAEAMLLRAIHGDDAVHDVLPLDEEVRRSPREEINRLAALYPSRDEDGRPIIQTLFSSVSNLPDTVADIGLHENHFRPVARATTAVLVAGKRKKKADAPEPVAVIDASNADRVFDDGPGDNVAEPAIMD